MNASKIPHTMIAAIYARKSRPDEGRHETEKSVTRQKDEARAYIERMGWTRGPVFEDDAISGKHGEDRRPGLKALLAAAEQEPRPFDVVVMAADDRLMRDQWKSALTLPPPRGGRAPVLLSGRSRGATRRRDGPLHGRRPELSSEMYRESVTRHMTDALKRKAKAGHVHGGRVFGYDNVRVDGHVERQINATEAPVVRRIFAQYAKGLTPKRIAADLTAANAPTPGRAGGWTTGTAWTKASVREVLFRETYRGVMLSRWGDRDHSRGQAGATPHRRAAVGRRPRPARRAAPGLSSGRRMANSSAARRTARSRSISSRGC